jgi:hypothetical protein
MCPKDSTPNCVLRSPCTSTHIASRAEGKGEGVKVVLTRRLLAYQTQSVATVNL